MQPPRLTVAILVLQAERLVSIIRYLGFLFQTTPTCIVAEPQQITVLIGHLTRNADVVAVEIAGFLICFAFFVGPVMYLCQRFVAVGLGVDIGIPSVRVDFLQEVAAVPNEAGFIRFCTVFPHSVFGAPSAQGIVDVRPSFFRAVFFEDFGFNQLVVQVVEIVLHFAVGQLAVDQVAEVVVVIGRTVVGFQAVVGDGIEIV